MSHWRMLKKIDEFGKDYDDMVKEWKACLEDSCKKEQVLSTILEVVEDAEQEVVPDGFSTINIANLGLSFPVSPTVSEPSISESSHTDGLSIAEVKSRVQLKMNGTFDEKSYNHFVTEIQRMDSDRFNSKMLKDIERNMSHPPTYQITGDNLDLIVKVKHMGSSNQNNDIHWFNLDAVQNRVPGNNLNNSKPIKSVLEMENVEFLPSPTDNKQYLHDITALATRVVIKNIPALSIFKDVLVHHIPHQYSDVMKQKSNQVK